MNDNGVETHTRRGTVSVPIRFETHINLLERFCMHVPADWQASQVARDSPEDHLNLEERWHLTVVNPDEFSILENKDDFDGIKVTEADVVIVGLGKLKSCMYACVQSSLLMSLRLANGLEPYDLHITLGFSKHDTFGVNKGLSTILFWAGDMYPHTKEMSQTSASISTVSMTGDGNTGVGTLLQHDLAVIKCRWYIHSTAQRRVLLKRLESVCLALARTATTLDAIDGKGSLSISWRTVCLSLALRSSMIRKAPQAQILALEDELRVRDPVEALYLRMRKVVVSHDDVENEDEILMTEDDRRTLHLELNRLAEMNTKFEKNDSRLLWLARAGFTRAIAEKGVWGRDENNSLSLLRLPLNMIAIKEYGYSLWGSGRPSESSIQAAMQLGVVRVVTLTEDPLGDKVQQAGRSIDSRANYHHYPIIDRHAPAHLEDLVLACRCIQRGLLHRRKVADGSMRSGRVLVHCLGGKGRTALVLASVLMLEHGMSPSEALVAVKAGGRRALVTEPQVTMLKRLYGVLHLASGNQVNSKLYMKCVPHQVPKILITCGFPGAGKSTFALTMLNNYPESVCHINQDELGRKATEEAWSRATFSDSTNTRITILDKCLPTIQARSNALRNAGLVSSDVTLIYFSRNSTSCANRAAARQSHVGDISGIRAQRVVESMAITFETPTKAEGFAGIETIVNDDDAEKLLRAWGCTIMPDVKGNGSYTNLRQGDSESACAAPSIVVVGFPRTRHLFDLGAATSDDIITSDGTAWLAGYSDEKNSFENCTDLSSDKRNRKFAKHDIKKEHGYNECTTVCVEEKIDGANMGFRLDEDGYTIVAQNRSHFVCSADHAQFHKLAKWQNDHEYGIRHVLRDQHTILYGEWVYATHSVRYNELPSYFIAFDLRCLLTNTFASREELENMLQGSGIPTTPLLLNKPIKEVSLQSIRRLVDRKSAYDVASASEGVYVRIQRHGLTVDRAKIVRQGFIAGNQRWDHGPLQMNNLQRNASEWTC
eukprot:CFRG0047T1